MKNSDYLWVQNLSRQSMNKPIPQGVAHTNQNLNQVTYCFLEELCSLVFNYFSYFNDLVSAEQPEAMVKLFQLSNPKPGLMLLKGKDKLVISSEGHKVRAKIAQVTAQTEKIVDILDFELTIDNNGHSEWIACDDKRRVNPELVARFYLSDFMIHGSRAFDTEKRDETSSHSQSPNETMEL